MDAGAAWGVIIGLLSIQTMGVLFFAGKVWTHEKRLSDLENGQLYCEFHKMGGQR